MRKSSAFLFITLFVIATVCCPTKAVSQASNSSETPQPKVTEGKLLQRVEPVYPSFAKLARINGTVVLEAVIGEDGSVKSATVVSGPPMLQQAAIDSVKQWKYQPYLLNCKEVEIRTTVNVFFSLGGSAPPQQSQQPEVTFAAPTQNAPDEAKPEAQLKLAVDFYDGTNGHPKDSTKAVCWLKRAANQGYAPAQYYLGTMYELGSGGLPKDDTEAVNWYRNAASQGYTLAETELGVLYQNGRGGVPKDDTQSASLYSRAAEQGNEIAEYNLGIMYRDGSGGLPRDESKTVYWWQKAAEQGNLDGQLNLGAGYEFGQLGLPKDLIKAQYWYRKAADQGNTDARLWVENISILIEALPQEQFAEELTQRMSKEIWWCAGGRDGDILSGYVISHDLTSGTLQQLNGQEMYVQAFRKGFRFVGLFDDVGETTYTARPTEHGSAHLTIYEMSDQQRAYLGTAVSVLHKVVQDNNSNYRPILNGHQITRCIPESVPESCPDGQIRTFMPGVGDYCRPMGSGGGLGSGTAIKHGSEDGRDAGNGLYMVGGGFHRLSS